MNQHLFFTRIRFTGLTLFLFLSGHAVSSQQRLTRTGLVIDAQSKSPLPFATIQVYPSAAAGASLLQGIQCDENGKFAIGNTNGNRLTLKVSYVGYQPYQQTFSLLTDTLLIALAPDASLLKEVKVTAQKNDLNMTSEKRVFDVSKNITSTGGTAENLLKNVPSVTLDESGNASLRNMATTIYVNGKPTQLTLAQIPSNQIESVEVISNPSARYDATTSGGIINLVLKKNRQPGYTGIISGGYGSNNRYDGMVNLDWYKGKWNMTAFYNLNATQAPLDGYVRRKNEAPLSFFNQSTLTHLDNQFQNGRINIDYSPDSRNVISFATTVARGAFNAKADQAYQYLNADGVVTSTGARNTRPRNTFTNTGVELDWKHSFPKKGQTLSVLSSFTHNRLSNAADWLTTAQDAGGYPEAGFPEKDQITGRTIGNQFIGQLDYVHPLTDSSKIEMGFRHYSFARDQTYFFHRNDPASDSWVMLPSFSQDAKITERVNALYFLYSVNLRHQISLQGGLRFEQSQLTGVSRLDSSRFGYDYPTGQHWFQSLFPSFSISKKWGGSELNFSASRKIGRPNFRHLFVGIQANDRQNVTIGNPKIQPEFVNTFELNYTRAIGPVQVLSTLYYIYEDHTIKPFVSPSATDSTVLITSFINVKADIRYGLDETVQFNLGKNFSAMLNGNVYNVILQAPGIRSQLWTYNAKMNLTYRFPANFSAQLSVNRESRSVQLQGFRHGFQGMDLAVRKSFMHNRASVTLAANDVFNSRRFVSELRQPGLEQLTMNRREIRYYKISLQLPLGKGEWKKKDRKPDRPELEFGN